MARSNLFGIRRGPETGRAMNVIHFGAVLIPLKSGVA